MRRILTAALCCAFLASPSLAKRRSTETRIDVGQNFNEASDRYEFAKAEFVKTDVHLSFVYYKTRKELEAAYTAKTGLTKHLNAYSIIRGDVCIINLVDPAVDYQPDIVGHEVLHCSLGRWH
jgi:hypothetical protein